MNRVFDLGFRYGLAAKTVVADSIIVKHAMMNSIAVLLLTFFIVLPPLRFPSVLTDNLYLLQFRLGIDGPYSDSVAPPCCRRSEPEIRISSGNASFYIYNMHCLTFSG